MALLDNLVSFWNLNETSGNATDAHGSNTLTDNNTVGSAAGLIGNARDFEAGNSEFLSHASNSDLQAGDINFSFACWVKLESSGSYIFLAKDVDTPANSRDYTLDINGGNPRFYINGGGGGLIVTSGSTLSTDTWYFIAAGHSASANELWISVNGGTPDTVSTGGTAPEVSNAEFRIGARAYSGFEGYYDGLIDLCGYWKRDIRSDLATLYNSGAGLDYVGMGGGGGSALPVFVHHYKQLGFM